MTVAAPVSETALRTGAGQLAVELVAGQSAATVVEARNPLKILVPRPRGQSVWACLSNYGGGLLPGDEIDLSVSISEGARCHLGTQSSTKIYRGGPKGAVRNNLRATVGSDAIFAYTPDVAQSFATARFLQNQSVDLADDSAGLIFLDWYSSGRSARGERWAFAEYTNKLEIRVAGRIAFLDSVRLRGENEIDLPIRMGRINCLATLLLLGDPLEDHALRLLKEIAALEISKRSETLVVASAIPGGAVLRFAGVSVDQVAHEIFPRLSFVSQFLGDNPFARKW